MNHPGIASCKGISVDRNPCDGGERKEKEMKITARYPVSRKKGKEKPEENALTLGRFEEDS